MKIPALKQRKDFLSEMQYLHYLQNQVNIIKSKRILKEFHFDEAEFINKLIDIDKIT